jgi:hypothetical protein
MTHEELLEEIGIELKLMETVVQDVVALSKSTTGREITNWEKTAASAYMAQFYTGIENILKRIIKFYNMPLPKTETWHIDLFNLFCSPAEKSLPVLFDESLKADLTGFRKFRHVVHHGYGFQIEWERMIIGIEKIEDIFIQFKTKVLGDWQELI